MHCCLKIGNDLIIEELEVILRCLKLKTMSMVNKLRETVTHIMSNGWHETQKISNS